MKTTFLLLSHFRPRIKLAGRKKEKEDETTKHVCLDVRSSAFCVLTSREKERKKEREREGERERKREFVSLVGKAAKFAFCFLPLKMYELLCRFGPLSHFVPLCLQSRG